MWDNGRLSRVPCLGEGGGVGKEKKGRVRTDSRVPIYNKVSQYAWL